jgi:hypothetical protein
MTDFGNTEERAAALRVALACKAINEAITAAARVGVNCKVIDLVSEWDDPSRLQVDRMERRTMILPAQQETAP